MRSSFLIRRVTLVIGAICAASNLLAQVARPEVVVYGGMPVDGFPSLRLSPNIFGPIVVSPDGGTIALLSHDFGASAAGFGIFVHRDGLLTRRLSRQQELPAPLPEGSNFTAGTVLSANDAGDVLLHAEYSAVSPSIGRAMLVLPGDDAQPRVVLYTGQELEQLPGRSIAGFSLPTNQSLPRPHAYVFPPSGEVFATITLEPQTLNNRTINSVLVRKSAAGLEHVLTAGPVEAWSSFRTVAGVDNAGNAIFIADANTPTGVRAGVWSWSAADGSVSPIAVVGDAAPGTTSGLFSRFYSASVNSAGVVVISGGVGTADPVPGVWRKAGDVLEFVMTSNSQVPVNSRTVSVTSTSSSVSIDDDSNAFVACGYRELFTKGRTSGRQQGIARIDSAGAVQLFARSDETVRGVPEGVRLATLSSVYINAPFVADGRIISSTFFTVDDPTVFPASTEGIVTWDADGTPAALLSKAQPIPFPQNQPPTTIQALIEAHAVLNGTVVLGRLNNGFNVVLRTFVPPRLCGESDFNNDRVYPDTRDLEDFLAVFAGGDCPALRCDTIDINRDGVFPASDDITAFLAVFAGGGC